MFSLNPADGVAGQRGYRDQNNRFFAILAAVSHYGGAPMLHGVGGQAAPPACPADG